MPTLLNLVQDARLSPPFRRLSPATADAVAGAPAYDTRDRANDQTRRPASALQELLPHVWRCPAATCQRLRSSVVTVMSWRGCSCIRDL